MPVQEMQGPFEISEDGTLQLGPPVLYLQPFNTTDLLSWKQHTLSYSEKPQAMIDLLESIFQTHQPILDDCHQLLLTLFTGLTTMPHYLPPNSSKLKNDTEFCQKPGGGSKDKHLFSSNSFKISKRKQYFPIHSMRPVLP
uniref:Core shell protein Gag P30 domain-containing protein n=1 Tax=Rousettus aegyptiacus TaxID=9407 RepID=A0A7J8CI72_ROUAE|nr:hypothetical protein HJG63_009062 [Rousettus aegyptiacus]